MYVNVSEYFTHFCRTTQYYVVFCFVFICFFFFLIFFFTFQELMRISFFFLFLSFIFYIHLIVLKKRTTYLLSREKSLICLENDLITSDQFLISRNTKIRILSMYLFMYLFILQSVCLYFYSLLCFVTYYRDIEFRFSYICPILLLLFLFFSTFK